MPPWLVLALLVSLTLALLYEIATRRYGWRLLVHWPLIFIAFLAAEVISETFRLGIMRVGELRLGPDLAGALLAIVILWFLGI